MKTLFMMGLTGALASSLVSCVPVEDNHRRHHDRHHDDRHHGHHHDRKVRTPIVTKLKNGNYLCTFIGGGSVSFDRRGHMLAKNGISTQEYLRARRMVHQRVR